MIERVHQHLLAELERTTRADTVFVVCAVLFNMLALFISWSNVPTHAKDYDYRTGSMGIYLLSQLGIIVISGAALKALHNGRRMCENINSALMKIYKDSGVDKYIPETATTMGVSRFRLSVVVVAGTSVLGIAIPFVQYLKL